MNPWTFENWNLTAQGQYVLKHGIVKAEAAAKEAGTTLGGKRPRDPNPITINNTYLFRKGGGSTSTGDGSGTSGVGPPT